LLLGFIEEILIQKFANTLTFVQRTLYPLEVQLLI
jgi:hypothetical protein